jgi:hypothetical protein
MIASAFTFAGAHASTTPRSSDGARITTFSPFHSCGLWLAVTITPAAAACASTITPTVGVIATPQSSTSHPPATNPAAAARNSTSPAARPSRASTTSGRFPWTPPLPPRNCSATTIANRAATSGVIDLPKMPRHPLTLNISGAPAAPGLLIVHSLLESKPPGSRSK